MPKMLFPLYSQLGSVVPLIQAMSLPHDRKQKLEQLALVIRQQGHNNQPVSIQFICTHNSRRSHMAQIWAQTWAGYFGIRNIYCYSGGTETTAVFPKVVETFGDMGFQAIRLNEAENALWAFKWNEDAPPVIAFSKTYDHPFNPGKNFIAVMTCSDADENCPHLPGATMRIALNYEDPKVSDGTPAQKETYRERALQIGAELYHLFLHLSSL